MTADFSHSFRADRGPETSGTDVAGFDGCPGGWLGIRLADGELSRASLMCVERLAEILAGAEAKAFGALAVDMSIGLPDRIEGGGRAAERLVRPLLGGRQSSVFSVPARKAVYADDYREACAIAAARSSPPRKVARQSFHLFPKIREVDALKRSAPALPLHECHPEVVFWLLNDKTPLSEPKKKRGSPYPPGLALRCRLLERAGYESVFLDTGLTARLPGRARADDFLDACAAAFTARRILRGEAMRFPDPPEHDEVGVEIAIHA